jgi:hypothetical protein
MEGKISNQEVNGGYDRGLVLLFESLFISTIGYCLLSPADRMASVIFW